jgi:hypothetical protein
VDAWLRQWRDDNRYWVWPPGSGGGRLDYFDEFAELPSVRAGADVLYLRLECRSGAKWWRDWLVLRILKDLLVTFTDLTQVNHIGDCPPPLSPD